MLIPSSAKTQAKTQANKYELASQVFCKPLRTARVAFVVGLDHYFPPAFGKVHPKWRTPYVAILAQAALAAAFLLFAVRGTGTAVEEFYLILLDTQLLI